MPFHAGSRSDGSEDCVSTPGLHGFLHGLPDDFRQIVLTLRDVVKRIASDAEERMDWDGLSFHRTRIGGPVKGAGCRLTCKRAAVRRECIHGVRLSDPSHRLLGDAISKRYVLVRIVRASRDPAIASLIREASELELGGPS